MSASNLLLLDDIRSTLATTHLGQHLHLHREIGSTNAEAMALAASGAQHGTVVVADSQTAGRGRQARTWFSPAGMNLYCSVLVRPAPVRIPFAEWLSWIPLASAVAITEAIRTMAGLSLSLKWPNDLLLDDKKVGGLLCENGTDQAKQPFVVIGIGLNVNAGPEAFPSELTSRAGSLLEATGRPLDRNRLLSQLLNDLEPVLEELAVEGPRRLLHAYTDRCATIGKKVRVVLAESRELLGVAQAIGRDGALHVSTNSQAIVEVRAADVIHLRE